MSTQNLENRSEGACRNCGSARLVAGLVRAPHHQGRIEFQPDDAPFFTFTSSAVPLSAAMCLDCGAVQIFGDVGKARRVVGDE